MRRIVVAGLLFPAALSASCWFTLARDQEPKPGEVSGRAIRSDVKNAPAPFARVSAPGTPIVRRTGKDGSFRITGLPKGTFLMRVADDADGDGFPERTGLAAAFVDTAQAATTPGAGFVLLGDVPLEGPMTVQGSVFVQHGTDHTTVPDDLIARIYLARGQCFDISPAMFAQPRRADCGKEVSDVLQRLELQSYKRQPTKENSRLDKRSQ